MTRRTTLLATTLPLLLVPSTAAPAHAVGTSVQAGSNACGTVTATVDHAEYGPDPVAVQLDDQQTTLVTSSRDSMSWTGLEGGRHAWRATNVNHTTIASGWVQVAACPGTANRSAEGDQTGDGRADLLAVNTAGDLYFYRSTGTGLAGGTRVGHGWGSSILLQRIREAGGPGTHDQLVSLRDDGTLWLYSIGANGAVTNGRQLASGLAGYDKYVVTPLNTDVVWGHYQLVATKGDAVTLLGTITDAAFIPVQRTVTPTAVADPMSTVTHIVPSSAFSDSGLASGLTINTAGTMRRCMLAYFSLAQRTWTCNSTVVGSGWDSMQLVVSPGSVDGDAYSDLVARRTDGNLYLYRVVNGSIRSGAQIGSRWQGIRLIA